jgi:hypothetical protein
MLHEYALPGNGNWIAHNPHKPIRLLAGILNHHGDLANRPGALDDARQREYEQKQQDIIGCRTCDDHGWRLPYGDTAVRCTHQ